MSTPTFRKLLRAAEAHLPAATPRLAPLIAEVGRCTLAPNPDVFRVLLGSVIAQFISSAAARSIQGRLVEKLKEKVSPGRVLALSDADLKACGIAGGKATSVRAIAEHFRRNRRYAAALAAADDDTARKMLLPLRGVGPWTVDMILIFSHGRPDVLPVGDLGVRAGARDVFGLSELPGPAELTALAEPWRPYRTIASWYLWRSRGPVRQSK